MIESLLVALIILAIVWGAGALWHLAAKRAHIDKVELES